MPITYSVANNDIRIWDFPVGTPCTLNDIYNADQSGGWGVFNKLGTNLFLSTAHIVCGLETVDTYLKIDTESLVFDNVLDKLDDNCIQFSQTGADEIGMEIKFSYFGLLDSSFANPRLITIQNGEGVVDIDTSVLYSAASSAIFRLVGPTQNDVNVKNLILHNCYPAEIIGNMSDVKINGGTYAMGTFEGDIQNVVAEGTERGIYYGGGIRTLRGIEIRDVQTHNVVVFGASDPSDYLSMVDCMIPAWVFFWYANSANATVGRKYSFNLKVDDNNGADGLQGAVVKMWDRQNNLVIDTTTNSGGEIAEQILLSHEYTWDGGSGGSDDNRGPFSLEISMPGYETYHADGMVVEEPFNKPIHLYGDGLGTKSISGKVLLNGQAVAVTVLLYRTADQRLVDNQISSGVDGTYQFDNLPLDNYYVVALPPSADLQAQVYYTVQAQ